MPYYEVVFIARQDLTDTQVKDMTAHFSKIITDAEGKVHKTEFWGLKNFAYRMNKSRKGHYVLLELDTEPAALHEMERQMRLHEDILRHQAIREEKLSEGPSCVMDKGGRDDDKRPSRDDKKPYRKDKEAA
ncbi:MAG: 30S ribosomal protein S6 [Alphaproteobacteria bacterium]|nr:MAG: 30S ribosomal protein S6 [Alphaproteobacteria bacterium]